MIYGYIRVSTEKQHTEQQRQEIMHYAEAKDIVVDDFISITISSRKNLNERRIQELLDMTEKGDSIIVVELSRLGRSIIEIVQMIDLFTQKGVSIKFTRQNFLDTGGDHHFQKVILSIFAAFAETERDLCSIRTKAGLKIARQKHGKLGPPSGPRKSKIDSYSNKIQKWSNIGLSAAEIGRQIGVPGSSIRRWAKSRGVDLTSDRKKKLLKELSDGEVGSTNP